MKQVRFYSECPQEVTTLKYAVVVAQYQGKWVFCRHKDRFTWEIPGGHLEPGETPAQAAVRELWEETGADGVQISPVCVYSFNDFGMLYYAKIHNLGQIPENSEIQEIGLFDELPDSLTYPHIQPYLFNEVRRWLKK